MSHKPSHASHDGGLSLDEELSLYLASDGLSFDFNAGKEHYDYQIAIGDDTSNVMGGTNHRDYMWGLSGNDSLSGGRQDDILYGDAGT